EAGRLAGAVGTDQCVNRAATNRQAHVADRNAAFELLRPSACFEKGVVGHACWAHVDGAVPPSAGRRLWCAVLDYATATGYHERQFGARLPRKASTPSAASGSSMLHAIVSPASAYALSSPSSICAWNARLPSAPTAGRLAEMTDASACTAPSSSVPGTTRLTRPQSSAVRASISSPVRSSSSVRLRPMLRPTPTAGVVQKMPALIPDSPNLAESAATARSHIDTSWHPAAAAAPWTRAITGCGNRMSFTIICVHASNSPRC